MNSGFQDTKKPPETPLRQGKTSQHHNWPRYMDCPQVGPKSTGVKKKKRQEDKWYLLRAPTKGGSQCWVTISLSRTEYALRSSRAGGHSLGKRHLLRKKIVRITLLVIFFSLTEAPLPDPTPTRPHPTPRKGPETDPKQTPN